MKKTLLAPKNLCISAVIAALYTVLTVAFAPISYGNIQCRLSEAMTLLPIIIPASIPGLFAGCLLSNLLAPTPSSIDIIFGSLTTLLAALATYRLRHKPVLAALPPVLFNGIIIGIIVHILYAPAVPLLLCMAEVTIGQAIAVFVAGFLLLEALKRIHIEKYI